MVNEKGLVAAAGRLDVAPPGFTERAHALLAAVGLSSVDISPTVRDAGALIADVRTAVQLR